MDQILNVLVIGLLLGGIYGLVSIGLNLIFGVIRIINFAQGELVMFGMYGCYWAHVQMGLSPYVSVFIVAPLVGLLGVVIQRVVLQPLQSEPSMQIFATFGLLMMFQNIMLVGDGGHFPWRHQSQHGTTDYIACYNFDHCGTPFFPQANHAGESYTCGYPR
jgi:branched-chain amino acid transport system permease protein